MARCTVYDVLTLMVTDMPLLIANRSFRYLDRMQDEELEAFLSYLVRFTAKKDSKHPSELPKWWSGELKFTKHFYLGHVRLPNSKQKLTKLRRTIRSCYAAYNALSLLALSEKLASKNDHCTFEVNLNDTATVYWTDQMYKRPIAVIPKSNLEYEQYSSTTSHRVGVLMNSGLTRTVHDHPIKKNLISYNQTVTCTEDDTDDDGCMIIPSSPNTEDEELPPTCPEASEVPPFEIVPNRALQLPNRGADTYNEGAHRDRVIIDSTHEEEAELAAQVEREKEEFFYNFMLMKVGNNYPVLQHQPVWSPTKKACFSLKKFTIDQVPFLVRIGLIPRRCLSSPEESARSMTHIEKYLL